VRKAGINKFFSSITFLITLCSSFHLVQLFLPFLLRYTLKLLSLGLHRLTRALLYVYAKRVREILNMEP
jgi:hypothetical protein